MNSHPDNVAQRFPAWSLVLLGLLILTSFGILAWLSMARYRGYNLLSYDLSNMSQAVWSAAHGAPLVFTTEGFAWSRLSLHVELFFFALAPLYALFPSPQTLLVSQAALYAVGAWPAYTLAQRRLHSHSLALGIAAIYLLYPVGQTAVLFEFHGDTLGMPLLLFAIEALDRQAWRQYAVWLILALGCKFYVALPVMALGGVLWWQGQRQIGVYTAVLSLFWGTLAFLIVRPAFAPDAARQAITTSNNYIVYYFGQINAISNTILPRFANALIVYGPALLLGIHAPRWLLPATVLALPTLLSNGPGPSYDYRYHHYALAVPFLIATIIYGAEALKIRHSRALNPEQKEWRGYIRLTFITVLIFHAALVDTPLSPFFYLSPPEVGRGLSVSGYDITSRDTFRDEWLAQHVPDNAAVAAGNLAGSRLVNREVLYRIQPQFQPFETLLDDVDYVIADALYDFAPGYSQVTREYDAIQLLLQRPEFSILQAQDGMILFGRSNVGLNQAVSIKPLPIQNPSLLAQFDDAIGLIDAKIETVSARRFVLYCRWLALRPLQEEAQFLAVSRLADTAHSRIVHLPTAAQYPTTKWNTEQIVYEVVEFRLPAGTPPGRYPLWVGWYDSAAPLAAFTDERTRLGKEFLLGYLEVR